MEALYSTSPIGLFVASVLLIVGTILLLTAVDYSKPGATGVLVLFFAVLVFSASAPNTHEWAEKYPDKIVANFDHKIYVVDKKDAIEVTTYQGKLIPVPKDIESSDSVAEAEQ